MQSPSLAGKSVELIIGIPAVTVVLLAAGRWLKRRRQMRLGIMYQILSLALAVGVVTQLAGIDLPFLEHLGPVLVILGTFFLIPLVDRLVWEWHFKQRRQIEIPAFIRQVGAFLLFVAAVLAVLGWRYDVSLRALVTGSGVAAVIVGFAMQDLLGNLLSCFAILFGKPFRAGDWLVVDTRHAEVVEINWRSTRLRTTDDIYLDVPNSSITKQTIVNLSYPTKLHAMRLQIGVDYNTPPNLVKEALREAALAAPGVCPKPAPKAFLVNFGDSAAVYEVRYWMDDQSRFSDIADAVRTNIWYNLRRNGIRIPYPTRTVQIERVRTDADSAALETAAGVLARQPLFGALGSAVHEEMLQVARHLCFGAGEQILVQAAAGDSMFILLKGEARVLVDAGNGTGNGKGPAPVAVLGAGECFGEMSLLTGEPRSATVLAVTDCFVLEISKTAMTGVIERHPGLLRQLSELLAQRRMNSEAALVDRVDPGATDTSLRQRQYAQSFLSRLHSFFEL